MVTTSALALGVPRIFTVPHVVIPVAGAEALTWNPPADGPSSDATPGTKLASFIPAVRPLPWRRVGGMVTVDISTAMVDLGTQTSSSPPTQTATHFPSGVLY